MQNWFEKMQKICDLIFDQIKTVKIVLTSDQSIPVLSLFSKNIKFYRRRKAKSAVNLISRDLTSWIPLFEGNFNWSLKSPVYSP